MQPVQTKADFLKVKDDHFNAELGDIIFLPNSACKHIMVSM